jgi:6-pyruvoyltetrahydropterin/6-carboxytetrahydropterin synthase
MSFYLVFNKRFSMAHRLIASETHKCFIPHGHNEYVKAKITASVPKYMDHSINMVEQFDKIKKEWHVFIDTQIDHGFQLSDKDPLIDYFRNHEPDKLSSLVITPGDPTTEIMCACLMSKLQVLMDNKQLNLQCVELQLEETPTNYVILEGYKSYEKHLPKGSFWWNRPDHTINDFTL